MDTNKPNKPLVLRSLHPEWTDEQVQKAEETLDRYLEVVVRIYRRLEQDPEAYGRFKELIAEKRVDVPEPRSRPPSQFLLQ